MRVRDPTVVRRQLGRHLRQLRHAANKTEADVEESSVMSRVTLWRIETGRNVTKVGDVRGLCWLYGAESGITEVLSAMALGNKVQGYWEDFNDLVPARFSLYRDLEGMASEIRVYAPESVHPQLQSPDYARAHLVGADPDAAEEVARGRIKLLLERQEVFFSRQPEPRMVAVLSDGVLARLVDSCDTTSGQIERLRELTGREQVDVRVLPWAAGAHPAMHVGPFTIMDFLDDDDPAVVCVETLTGIRYLEKPSEVGAYRRAFARIYQMSHPIGEQHGTTTPAR